MQSCLYQGVVGHRRLSPVAHGFRYGLWMAYLDLGELPELVAPRGPLSTARFAAASFRPTDHLRGSDAELPLDEAVRREVERQSGRRPAGPVRLLTGLRHWGCYFSPLNLFYCFDRGGMEVEAVLAEVSNTPWNERHHYLLWEGNRVDGEAECGQSGASETAPETRSARPLRFAHPKAFHVSPFMDMESRYVWRLARPGERLAVHLATERNGRPFFSADLRLERKPLSRRTLVTALWRYPWMTARVTAAIYYQALRLRMKRCPFYEHPDRREPAARPAEPTHGPAGPQSRRELPSARRGVEAAADSGAGRSLPASADSTAGG